MLGVDCAIQSACCNKYAVHAGGACPALPLESILHEAAAAVPVAATRIGCVGNATQLWRPPNVLTALTLPSVVLAQTHGMRFVPLKDSTTSEISASNQHCQQNC